MRASRLAVALLMCAGCLLPSATTAAVPALDRKQAERLALEADAAEQSAMARADATGLSVIFRDGALTVLLAQAQRLVQSGVRIEEKDPTRQLVFFDPHALEAVLMIESQQRLLSPGFADPPWSATARQWWMRFRYVTGLWWVVDQHDLTPDRWFPIP